jgi:hypothetical protein
MVGKPKKIQDVTNKNGVQLTKHVIEIHLANKKWWFGRKKSGCSRGNVFFFSGSSGWSV